VTVLTVAHRAGNSLAGLHAARVLGADVIECDVHHYRGRLEVRHLKTAGPLPFLWDRWELAPAWAPRLGLAELLSADRQGATFMLDLKGRRPEAARAVVGLLREVGTRHPVLVCGRWWPAVDTAAELPFVRPVLSARNPSELARLRRRVAAAPGAVHGASVHASLLDRMLVGELHRGLDVVMTWPVNDRDELARVLGLGVSGVISDEPEVLAALLRDRRRTGPP
jgi:glycerophosphoryl diester phosphodiesterase